MSVKEMPPLPASTFEVEPTPDEAAFFAENGYLVVERITTDEELAWLTVLYEHIFDPAQSNERGAPVDRTNGTGENGVVGVSQAFFPEFNYPLLLQTTFNRNARRYAAALLGVGIERLSSWGHMIRKLPGGREAPWHQDEAFWEPELRYHALGCWLPLHEVTEEMGAMQFIPGSHKGGVLHHTPKNGDVALHVLAADDVDVSQAVSCPLPAGGATFHHCRTLHYTAPNTTTVPRLAFPTEFEVTPTWRDVPADRPWVDDWRDFAGHGAPTVYPADGEFVAL
jgi:ectoine hydroxylase-related dioxygenase (phytanoyl-CoA dioxygenase family)